MHPFFPWVSVSRAGYSIKIFLTLSKLAEVRVMKKWLATGWLLLVLPVTATAQQIPVKTVPVATGNQFMIFPSQNMSMGGVSIALDDPLYDAFVNPAKGISIQGVRFTGTPSYYGVSMRDDFLDDASSTRTLPVGMLVRQGTLFGGAVMAWQEMTKQDNRPCCFADFARPANTVIQESSSTTRNNVYAFAMGGAQLPGTNLSVGVSAFTADLNGLEGVRLLYSDGNRVDQDGKMSSFRLGFLQQWDDGRSAELAVQRHRFKMDHEMTQWVWDEERGESVLQTRLEQDETNGWAVLAGFQQPLNSGWRLGVRLVGDWKDHPKIPNYDLMQIPRDPGNTSAYNIGVGLSRTIGQTTWGFDLIYEPIWSHTWADAAEDTPIVPISPFEGPTGDVIPAGEMTVENFFRFNNSIFRLGVRQAGDRLDFGLGLNLHIIRYQLDQENFVQQFKRELDESWGEWTFSLGLGYTFTGFQLRYLSLITLGTGRPGIDFGGARNAAFDQAALESSFVVAPAGPLALQDARVWTHQLSILIPIAD